MFPYKTTHIRKLQNAMRAFLISRASGNTNLSADQ